MLRRLACLLQKDDSAARGLSGHEIAVQDTRVDADAKEVLAVSDANMETEIVEIAGVVNKENR